MRKPIEERYLNDAVFYNAVQVIYSLMGEDTELTSLDIRDACYLARLKFETDRPRSIVINRQSMGPLEQLEQGKKE